MMHQRNNAKQKELLKSRLTQFGGDSKLAFSDLEKNPIWLNKEKGIQISRVKIKGAKDVVALHNKKDNHGNEIIAQDGLPVLNDFVRTGNNHHAAAPLLHPLNVSRSRSDLSRCLAAWNHRKCEGARKHPVETLVAPRCRPALASAIGRNL